MNISGNSLSTFQRKDTLDNLRSRHFDVLVIGGGITGAGIALDAASRGMSVALVEKNDFASGTSSKSTKLIHGGLRYLKQFEFGLVKEVGQEREILHRNAPHIVKPENMLLPIIKEGSLGRLSTALGLSVYDWLAGVKLSEWKSMLTAGATKRKEPLLKKNIIKGGALYKEYRTDDARLVIEVMKTAVQYGGVCMNYAEAAALEYTNEKVSGAKLKDHVTQETFSIRAKKVINAAGPWVDEVRKKDDSIKGKKLHLTKGVHLVVPLERLPVKQSAYFDVPDGRMIFVIPRGKKIYIGTTDTNYNGEIDQPQVSKEDAAYLLEAVNNLFPTANLTFSDISSSWAGLRPLIHEEGKGPSELSRKDEVFISRSGLISIAGGKLTGYRKMAERAVDIVADEISHDSGMYFKNCFTDRIKLSGGDFKDEYELAEFKEQMQQKFAGVDIATDEIENLIDRYGSNAPKIFQSAESAAGHFNSDAVLTAELQYGIEAESVTDLSDHFIRRTGKLFFEREKVEREYSFLKNKIEELLQWNEAQKMQNHQQFMDEFAEVVDFK